MPEAKSTKQRDDVIDALKRQIVKLEQRIDALEGADEPVQVEIINPPWAPLGSGTQRMLMRLVTK